MFIQLIGVPYKTYLVYSDCPTFLIRTYQLLLSFQKLSMCGNEIRHSDLRSPSASDMTQKSNLGSSRWSTVARIKRGSFHVGQIPWERKGFKGPNRFFDYSFTFSMSN